MKLENRTYDILKRVALMIAPLITFLAALGDIWGLPYMVEITATLAALDTLLGAFLNQSSKDYWRQNDERPFE